MVDNEEILLVKSVGEKIRQRRTELNLSQESLSFDADIPRNQVGRIERAEINTSINTIFKLANALHVSVKDLFDFEQ